MWFKRRFRYLGKRNCVHSIEFCFSLKCLVRDIWLLKIDALEFGEIYGAACACDLSKGPGTDWTGVPRFFVFGLRLTKMPLTG